MDELNAITELLYSPGEPMSGSPMTDEQALAYAREHCWRTEFCLVRQWLWIDLDVAEAQRIELAKTQRQPALIYAHSVIYDSARRWDVGDFVRTSPLYRFDEGFLFKTLNSIYVLLGDGQRKRATLETVGRIF
ncbi:DUF6957 family protein [Stutzerimonas stutzeri]|uniref:DUF6957 family protein n=1 Tax=Stutzerimonas stutzeri TaxID=316 RepID=UPI00301333CB